MLRLLSVVLVCLLPSIADATIRYVDSTAGACSGNYSIANRNCTGADGVSYATVTAATSAASAGDFIYLRAGVYTSQINTSGKAGVSGSPITLATCPSTVCPGETVRGAIIRLSGSGRSLNDVTTMNWWVFDNLTWDGVNGTEGTSGIQFSGTPSKHDVWFTNSEIKNFGYNGFYLEGDNHVIRNNLIHDQVSSTCVAGNRWYGIYYAKGNNGLIEGNQIYNNPAGGIHIYPGPLNGLIVRKNIIRNNNTVVNGCNTVGFSAILAGGTGTQIYHNLIYQNGVAGSASDIDAIRIYTPSADNQLIANNTFYDNRGPGYTIRVTDSTMSNNRLANNHIVAGSGNTGTILNNGTGTILSTNRTTGAITDCAVSTSDFTQKAGSACIDAGTNVGLSYNGTAPDIGAFETFAFSVCSVANGSPSVINATFENNVFPPLVPSTGVTTFTARKATVNDVVTGVVRTGDNQLDISVTNAYINTDAIDISWASGNLTDSALIGGTLSQPFLPITNRSCTNNVGGAPTHLFIQAAYEFHGLRGTEAAPVVIPYSSAAENTAINVVVGGKARLRMALTCTTADCPPTGFYLYYSKDGGAYAVVPDSFGADNIAFCGTGVDLDIPASGTATTDQLSTSGTFVPAALVRTSNAIPTIDLAQNNKTEPEYCLAWDTDTTADATYDFRIRRQDGTAIDTYTVTPRATVRAMSAGMGF